MTTLIQDIPLSKLIPSALNVRRTAPKARVDELAASIAAHGLLQNLTVRLAPPAEGNRKAERFEVIAGGRRLAALKLLARQKLIAGNAPIPCHVIEEGTAEEISLAENALQCPMHPADQFEAFARRHDAHGMSAEDIAARFGVTANVVRQRLKLGAISPALMQIYRDGDINLDQLTAFAITDDHARQERVWAELPGFNRSRDAILAKLNEDSVSVSDRRAIFVGAEAYQQAGGIIIRDLFDEDEGGFFADAELLDRMVRDKLQAEATRIEAEGWKWVEIMPVFDYGATSSLRRIYAEPVALTQEAQARLAEIEAEYEGLTEEDDTVRDRLEAEIAALTGEERYAPDELVRAGAFVCLGYNGEIRIERGFLRPEDAKAARADSGTDPGSAVAAGPKPLSDRLIAELTSYRTLGLRHALAQQPDMALRAVVHALASEAFFHTSDATSSLQITARSAVLSAQAPLIEESHAAQEIEAQHEGWAKRLPEEPQALWSFIMGLEQPDLLSLLAHCAARSLNAVQANGRGVSAHADALAQSLALDMTGYWRATSESYFGRVPKDRILDAVREGLSDVTADALSGLKKQAMAKAAEERLAGTGWLPGILRTP